jgi:hypothetical protein
MAIETDDQRNERLRTEVEAKPNFAQYKRDFDLQHSVSPITSDDLKKSATTSETERERLYKNRYGTGEISSGTTVEQPVPDSELSPELRALKEKYESQAGKTEGQKPPEKELSPEEAEIARGAPAAAAELHGRYGPEAPNVIARAQRVAAHFQAKGPEWETLAMDYIKRHGQVSAVEFLSQIKIEDDD